MGRRLHHGTIVFSCRYDHVPYPGGVANMLIDVLKRKLMTTAIVVVSALASFISPTEVSAGKVVIGSTPTGHLMWIAEELGYFKESGSEVDLRQFSSGVTTSKALATGEINLANSSEFAFVNNVMRHRDLRMIASISRTNSANLFGRKDSGIRGAADLVGRKIGVTRRGIGEFFLGEYLSIHGISIADVELVDLRPPAIVKSISEGTIDAAITWEPSVYLAQKALGDNFMQLPDQDSYYYHFVVAGKRDWLYANQADVQNVLAALVKAQAYVSENPEKSQAIIAAKFNLDPVFVRDTWHKYILEVTLLQTLLSLMEQEAYWLIENKLIDVTSAPNFLEAIDAEPLKAVSPKAVQLIQ